MASKPSKLVKGAKNGSNGKSKQTLKSSNNSLSSSTIIESNNVDSPVTRKIETNRTLRPRDLTKNGSENLIHEIEVDKNKKKKPPPSLQVSARKKVIISGSQIKPSPNQVRTRSGNGNDSTIISSSKSKNNNIKKKTTTNSESNFNPVQAQKQQVKSLPKDSNKKVKKLNSTAVNTTLTTEIRNPVEKKKNYETANDTINLSTTASIVLVDEEYEQDKENSDPNLTVPSRSVSTASSSTSSSLSLCGSGIKNFYSKTNDKEGNHSFTYSDKTSTNALDVLDFECAKILTKMRNSNNTCNTERPVLATVSSPLTFRAPFSKSYKVPKSPQVGQNNSPSSPSSSQRRRAFSLSDIDLEEESSSSSDLPEFWDEGVTPQIPGFSGKGILKSSSPKTNNVENNKKHTLNDSLSSSPKRRHVEFAVDNNHTRFFHCENMAKKGRIRHVPGGKRDRQLQELKQQRRRSYSEFINSNNNYPWAVPSQPWNINTSFLPVGQQINPSGLFEFQKISINFDSVVTAKLLMKHLVSDEGRSLCELMLGNEEVMKILLEEMLKRSDFKEKIISTIKNKSTFNILSFVDEIMREEVKDKCTVGMTPSMPSGFWCKMMETFITSATNASSIMVTHNQSIVNTTTTSTVPESQNSQTFETTLMREYALKIMTEDPGALDYVTSEIAKKKSSSQSS